MTNALVTSLLLPASVVRPGTGGGPAWVAVIAAVLILAFIIWKVRSGRG